MARMRILVEQAGVELTAALNDSATAAVLWRGAAGRAPGADVGRRGVLIGPGGTGEEDSQATVVAGRGRLLAAGRGRVSVLRAAAREPGEPRRQLERRPSVLEAVRDGHVVRLEPVEG